MRSDDLARRYSIKEKAVGNALRRQERRGLVEHVSNRIYINKLAHEFSSKELVNLLRPEAYVSLESALAEWRISTQNPSMLTCVTTEFGRKFLSPSVHIVYHHIGKPLYWGFQEKRTRHGLYKIAEPEKALLDWIYLKRQEGLPVALDELNLRVADREKLPRYGQKYPKSAKESLSSVLMVAEKGGSLNLPRQLLTATGNAPEGHRFRFYARRQLCPAAITSPQMPEEHVAANRAAAFAVVNHARMFPQRSQTSCDRLACMRDEIHRALKPVPGLADVRRTGEIEQIRKQSGKEAQKRLGKPTCCVEKSV